MGSLVIDQLGLGGVLDDLALHCRSSMSMIFRREFLSRHKLITEILCREYEEDSGVWLHIVRFKLSIVMRFEGNRKRGKSRASVAESEKSIAGLTLTSSYWRNHIWPW